MTRYRMTPGDAAWLHMDRATNHMIVNSVMWFDEPMDWDAVRAVVQDRIVERFPRFSQRVVDLPTSIWWEDDADFDLDNHLHHAALPSPGGRAELERYLSGLLHAPLPTSKPLWELHLIDGYNGRGSAIVSRLHHCIADGVALMRVMMSLTDDADEADEADVLDAVQGKRSGILPSFAHLAGTVAETVAGNLVHPSRVVDSVRDGASAALTLTKLLAMPPDANTALRGRAGLNKQVVWSDPTPLRKVSAAAHAAGVTVNDLVLAAVSGALRAYLAREDGHSPDIRAIMPVNLRPLDEPLPAELGNRFGLAFLTLPVSIDDPQQRLAEVRRRSTAIKHSPEGLVTFEVLGVTGRTPYAVEQLIVDVFASKGTAVMTNVPGPRRAVFLAGRKVRGTIGWPPVSGNMSTGLSIISYDGELIIGLMTDTGLVPDPQFILAEIQREIADLLQVEDATTAQASVAGPVASSQH